VQRPRRCRQCGTPRQRTRPASCWPRLRGCSASSSASARTGSSRSRSCRTRSSTHIATARAPPPLHSPARVHQCAVVRALLGVPVSVGGVVRVQESLPRPTSTRDAFCGCRKSLCEDEFWPMAWWRKPGTTKRKSSAGREA
jgi:hypothetical protein